MLRERSPESTFRPDRPPIEIEDDSGDLPRVVSWSPASRIATQAKHPTLMIALHWGSLLAIVISVGAMFLRDAVEDSTTRLVLLHVHRQLGLLVLVGAAVRIALRLYRGFVDHAPDMMQILRWAARAAHVGLYGLLIALPLVGWACTSAHGISLAFLGVWPLPGLVAADSEFADTLSDYHVLLSWVLLGVVAAHASAALWHHYVRRDSVLSAMLPRWIRRLPPRLATDDNRGSDRLGVKSPGLN